MDKRVLRIVDINGETIREIDISTIDHANSASPIIVDIMTRCDMGEYHSDSRWAPPPWGRRIKLGGAICAPVKTRQSECSERTISYR